MSELEAIDSSIIFLNEEHLINLLLYGNKKYDIYTNRMILQATIDFLKNSLRFDEALF